MSDNRRYPRAARQRGGRTLALGNVLIVLGIALLGGALSIAAQAGGGPVSDAVVTAPATLSPAPAATSPAPPPIQALAPTAPATPAPSFIATPSATPIATPVPTSTPPPELPPPTRIRIAAVGIDTPIVEVGFKVVMMNGQPVIEWQVADYAAGHHDLSANPGARGNIVISGHNDWKGQVFRTLDRVKIGDDVTLTTPKGDYHYRVTEIHYRKDVGVPLSERLATGQFLAPMPEERLTLVTCWPYGVDDHRLIVVAKPVKP